MDNRNCLDGFLIMGYISIILSGSIYVFEQSTERFVLDKDFMVACVCVLMHSRSQEFWDEETCVGIGDALRYFVEVFEVTNL